MRILHVTPYWADAWAYGGIPRIVGALVRHQAGAGHRVTVCTTDAHSRNSRRPAATAPESGGVDLRIFRNRSNRLAYDWQCFTPAGMHRYLRDHVHEFDVAHVHACRNLPGALAAHYLDRYGVPYVLAPNGTAPVIERRRLAKRAFDVLAGTRMLRHAAAVIAVSQAERAQLSRLGVPDDRIHVVPNPIELSEFTPPIERGRFRRRAGFTTEKIVTFLGKITPRKRLDVLVRAFARLPDSAHLVLAGNDMGGLDGVRALASRLGVTDRVHMPGLLAGRDRLEVLADADVVVYPGQDEIFGLVPLEALLAGTPVIVADDSGCGEIVTRVGGGIVTAAGDDRALAKAIGEIVDAGAGGGWRSAAVAAADRVRADYGARGVADRLTAVYETRSSSWEELAIRCLRRLRSVRHLRRLRGPKSDLRASVPLRASVRDSRSKRSGVSFVVPVKNGTPHIARTLASIEAQADGRPLEIIVVDDRSEDGSAEWLTECAGLGRIRLVAGAGRGVSAALNLGMSLAAHPIVCQVDQDVELLPGWMSRLAGRLDADADLGAVEGQYTVDPSAPVLARLMALDLEQRYASAASRNTDHVCTGNTAFRLKAVRDAGGFDETLGYANDNDLSRRLLAGGWRLAHCRQARSFHSWRNTLAGYCRQQYGFGYGRLEFVSRGRGRASGDSVAPAMMMAHPIAMMLGLAALVIAVMLDFAHFSGASGALAAAIGAAVIGLLIAERAVAGIRAFVRFGDPAALLFPVVHAVRDLSWVAAIVVWTTRRTIGRGSQPSDSMQPRPAARLDRSAGAGGFVPRATRTIGIIPSHNEAATIGAVIADVRNRRPDLDLLVVDDGSTDHGAEIAARTGVRLIELPERMGVGTAMRTGLRYARRLGYDSAIRLDADGQHRAVDIDRLLAPIAEGNADVVLGSRFLGARCRTNVGRGFSPGNLAGPEGPAYVSRGPARDSSRAPASRGGPAVIRIIQRGLAACLSLLTRRDVTDATCGFSAFGPRALRLLADEHPTGYPEPEMRLLFSRHRLTVVEVPVEVGPRLGGRTSLTVLRLGIAGARVLLAMLIVPLRSGSDGGDDA